MVEINDKNARSWSARRVSVVSIGLIVTAGIFGLSTNDSSLRSLQGKDTTNKKNNNDVDASVYKPAMIEKYIYDNRVKLGYDTKGNETAEGCKIWNDPAATTIYDELHAYRKEIVQYWDAVDSYSRLEDRGITDVRKHLNEPNICTELEVDPQKRGLVESYFPSGQLSFTKSSGWIEPLAPPMRHPNFCMIKKGNVLNTKYLVHDFSNMCKKLKPTSRIVLFDLGASPKFARASSPTWKLIDLYNKFGFKFDHIYAYEIKFFSADEIYEMVPRHLQSAYHWINAGVRTEEGHNLNPWTILENEFEEDDFVVVKLDIDTSSLELPLAQQLFNTPKLLKLVDHFYFEHHVHQTENTFWRKSWGGSIKDTLDLFYGLRERGVPAHFWV